ncbi:MAG TPA: sigma-70 family RNA polymerase sigma factor [Terriglobales bacterium]|nr:sigma-70 family RNA polymerase sigma factor [Terriglobales bacterium]
MGDPSIAAWQQELRSARAQEAWVEFLENYGAILLQAVRRTIWDPERAADCFVFVCEQLSARGYRRLLQYRPESETSFVTWLRVVVRNLALDWHRKQYGRQRTFESVGRLSSLHQEIYRLRYQDGRSLDEVCLELRGRFPELNQEEVQRMDAEVRQSLSPRQQWLLAAQRTDTVALDAEEETQTEVADPAPGPEDWAISAEEWQRLGRGLAKLEAAERLLLQLRFGQGATLAKIAQFAGLPDAQTADRRIRTILDKLRRELE